MVHPPPASRQQAVPSDPGGGGGSGGSHGEVDKDGGVRAGRGSGHKWELPGNYRDFIVVMVFYLFFWRTKRIFVTAITGFKIYILIHSLIIFI